MKIAFKVDFAISISVKYVDNTLYEWILMQLWQGHKFFNTQWTRLIEIKFAESLSKSLDFFCINCSKTLMKQATYSSFAESLPEYSRSLNLSIKLRSEIFFKTLHPYKGFLKYDHMITMSQKIFTMFTSTIKITGRKSQPTIFMLATFVYQT